jgi:hypothetical protein
VSKKSGKFKPKKDEPSAATNETRASSRRRDASNRSRDRNPGAVVERYRNLIAVSLVAVAVAIVGFLAVQSGTAASYSCGSLLTLPPESAAQPGAAGTEPQSFALEDHGRDHTGAGRSVRYVSCPPTSGDHGSGALPRQFFGPGSVQQPRDWLHNLEHGYAVIAYAGDPGSDVLDQIRNAMDGAVPSEVAVSCGLPNKVLAFRFDDMSEPFAVLAWDKALLMSTFDAGLATNTAERFQDGPAAPERAC